MTNRKMILLLMGIISILGIVIALLQLGNTDISIDLYHQYSKIEDYPIEDEISIDEQSGLIQGEYVVVFNKNSEISNRIKNNIIKVLEYTKKKYTEVEVSKYNKVSTDKTIGVIICVEELDDVKCLKEIMSYVEQGGSMMLAIRPVPGGAYNTYSEDFGITNQMDFKIANGIKLETNLVINQAGFEMIGDSIVNSCLDLKVSSDSKVYASTPSGIPLIWEKIKGDGKIVVINGTFFDEISSRGVVISAIGLMSDYFMYPIINSGVYFLILHILMMYLMMIEEKEKIGMI